MDEQSNGVLWMILNGNKDCVRFMNQRQLTDYVDLDSTKVAVQAF